MYDQYSNYFINYEKLVKEASQYIKTIIKQKKLEQPLFAITLGSGLGELANTITDSIKIPYQDIPHFPTTTVAGHEGTLIIGKLAGIPIIGLKGRKHYYEIAHEPFNNGILKTVFAVNIMAELGVKNYFVTNASGGLNLNYQVGDVMIINSHINLIPNPLLGPTRKFKQLNHTPVWRFQPMNEAYNPTYQKLLRQQLSSHLHTGTYLAVTGPTFETEAECIAFRDGLKADCVGMSTAPEVITARHRGMKVVGFSCITNVVSKDGVNNTNHEEVQAILNSKKVKQRLNNLVINFFKAIKNQ